MWERNENRCCEVARVADNEVRASTESIPRTSGCRRDAPSLSYEALSALVIFVVRTVPRHVNMY